jgi:hypothetical protein
VLQIKANFIHPRASFHPNDVVVDFPHRHPLRRHILLRKVPSSEAAGEWKGKRGGTTLTTKLLLTYAQYCTKLNAFFCCFRKASLTSDRNFIEFLLGKLKLDFISFFLLLKCFLSNILVKSFSKSSSSWHVTSLCPGCFAERGEREKAGRHGINKASTPIVNKVFNNPIQRLLSVIRDILDDVVSLGLLYGNKLFSSPRY